MSASTDPIQEMVQRLRSGEETVVAELFSHYRDQLWRMVDFRLDPRLNSRIDPSDVLQEAYLDAVKRVGHYIKGPADGSFIRWLRQITEQSMIDLHRRHLGSQMRDIRREIPLSRNFVSPTTSTCIVAHLMENISSPSQKAVRAEVEQSIEQALNRMDAIDREVLALRHFEELSNNEVAEVLGLKPSAASNRYFRALKRLRTVLADMPEVFGEYEQN